MKQHNLTVPTTHTYLVICNRLDTLDPLSAHILREHHDLVLDLKATEVSALSPSEQKLLRGLAEGQAAVISHECASVNQFRLTLPVRGVQRPKV